LSEIITRLSPNSIEFILIIIKGISYSQEHKENTVTPVKCPETIELDKSSHFSICMVLYQLFRSSFIIKRIIKVKILVFAFQIKNNIVLRYNSVSDWQQPRNCVITESTIMIEVLTFLKCYKFIWKLTMVTFIVNV